MLFVVLPFARTTAERAGPDGGGIFSEVVFPPQQPHFDSTYLFPPQKEHHMSFYDAVVPAYLQMLNSLSGLLTKAEAHCQAKKIEPDVLLGARLYPDMLPFSKQIQLVTDFASKGCARLTHSEVPSTPDTEKTFGELKQRLAKTIDYVKSFKPAQFEGADSKDVTFPTGPSSSMTVTGQQFLSSFSFPNFYFHAATAHGILRHNGVEIGKRDFLGVS
jgi:uncharacterized protein